MSSSDKMSQLREKMSQMAIRSTCPHHPSLTVEFFCPICFVPVCVHCKMVGSHSTGEASQHKLVGIAEAYTKAFSESQQVFYIYIKSCL